MKKIITKLVYGIFDFFLKDKIRITKTPKKGGGGGSEVCGTSGYSYCVTTLENTIGVCQFRAGLCPAVSFFLRETQLPSKPIGLACFFDI